VASGSQILPARARKIRDLIPHSATRPSEIQPPRWNSLGPRSKLSPKNSCGRKVSPTTSSFVTRARDPPSQVSMHQFWAIDRGRRELGVDGAGKGRKYWQTLGDFWPRISN
jgi:hypothetical protein